eukprot:scaffold62556_cov69-Phaeocystis_antarctica.AAC.7
MSALRAQGAGVRQLVPAVKEPLGLGLAVRQPIELARGAPVHRVPRLWLVPLNHCAQLAARHRGK